LATISRADAGTDAAGRLAARDITARVLDSLTASKPERVGRIAPTSERRDHRSG
jgi:hypothetical protein